MCATPGEAEICILAESQQTFARAVALLGSGLAPSAVQCLRIRPPFADPRVQVRAAPCNLGRGAGPPEEDAFVPASQRKTSVRLAV